MEDRLVAYTITAGYITRLLQKLTEQEDGLPLFGPHFNGRMTDVSRPRGDLYPWAVPLQLGPGLQRAVLWLVPHRVRAQCSFGAVLLVLQRHARVYAAALDPVARGVFLADCPLFDGGGAVDDVSPRATIPTTETDGKSNPPSIRDAGCGVAC